MNKVILMGRFTKDPEVRTTTSGKTVVSFTVATGRGDNVEFSNCIAWEKTAELISQYFNKGSQILLEGRLKTRSYESNGSKRYTTEVIVSSIEFTGSKSDNQQGTAGHDAFGGTPANADDIPF